MTAPDLRPLSVGETLDVSFKLFRRSFTTLAKIVAIVVIPFGILSLLIVLSVLPEEEDIASGAFLQSGDFGAFIVGIIAGTIIGLVASMVATGASFRAVGDTYMGRAPDSSESLRFAGRRLGSLIWVSLLLGLAVLIGFLLLIIPGIYLAVAFSVAIPVLMLEDKRGASALGRSRDLVSGRWWPVLGVLVVGYILAGIVVGIVVGIPFAILTSGIDSFAAAQTIGTIQSIIEQIILVPLQAAILVVVYFDLRVRKEGFDLQLLAERIENDPGSGADPRPPDRPPPPPAGP